MIEIKTNLVFEIGVGNIHSAQSKVFWSNPEIKCVLFEPNPFIYFQLAKDLQKFDNVKIYNIAIFDKDSFDKKLILAGNQSFIEETCSFLEYGANYMFKKMFSKFKVPIICSNITHFDNGNIDVLFLSVEGCEWFILKNLKSIPKFIKIKRNTDSGYSDLHINNRYVCNWLFAKKYIPVEETPNHISFYKEN